jgi:hypothetical protein
MGVDGTPSGAGISRRKMDIIIKSMQKEERCEHCAV